MRGNERHGVRGFSTSDDYLGSGIGFGQDGDGRRYLYVESRVCRGETVYAMVTRSRGGVSAVTSRQHPSVATRVGEESSFDDRGASVDGDAWSCIRGRPLDPGAKDWDVSSTSCDDGRLVSDCGSDAS